MARSPYTILGIQPSATDAEIKLAYRRACAIHHPDRGGNKGMFQDVQWAFEELQKRGCQECDGTGFITERRGVFASKLPCPRCWRK